MFRKVLFGILSIILCTLLVACQTNELERLENGEELDMIKQLLFDYVSFAQSEDFESVSDIIFLREEHRWFVDNLVYMWEPYDIIEVVDVEINFLTDGLYSSKILLYVLIEDATVYKVVDINPFIANIDSEWRIIIHPRDIPDEFGFSFELAEDEIDVGEIIFLD